jgi:spore coat protein U-like protein
MKTGSTAALAALLALAASGGVAAKGNCDLSISDAGTPRWTGGRNAGYEVFDPEQYALVVDFSISSGKRGCSFFATVTSATAAQPENRRLFGFGGTLAYQIYGGTNLSPILKDVPLAGPNDVLPGGSSGRDTIVPMRYVLVIPPLQVVGPGLYGDQLLIKVYEGTPANAVLDDQKSVFFLAAVPSTAEFTFAAGNSLDFGALQPGAQQSISVLARGNAGFRFLLQSQNQGTLRNTDPGDSSAIPYTLFFDGAAVPLQSGIPTQIFGTSGATSAQGQTDRIDVRIGDLGNASAGTYQDNVQITIQSLR